jgi:RNA polymerase sigma factor (sigma-70 family)
MSASFNIETIYNEYVDDLLSYGVGLGFQPELIKDAIQDIFYKLYLKRGELSEVRNMKYYLFGMLKHRLLDLCKNSVETDSVEGYENRFVLTVTAIDHIVATENQQEIRRRVEKLLSTLTDRQREAIYLRFKQELSYEEIASLLDMSVYATRNLVFRAMERMRKSENLGVILITLVCL